MNTANNRHSLLLLLALATPALAYVHSTNSTLCPIASPCTLRTYYIQAEEVEWDYAPSGMNQISHVPLRDNEAFEWTMRYKNRIGSIYKKAQYIGYTDNTFTQKTHQPKHLGILGPVVRAEVGDIIHIVFRNKCAAPYGVHSHGVKYIKEHEGATYANTPHVMGSAVPTDETHQYTWIANERSGPGPADGNSSLWAYHSHNEDPGDIYSGLIGPIIIYRPGVLDKKTHLPTDVDYEFILHFLVFNENLSPYLRDNIVKYAPELSDRLLKNPDTPFTIGGEKWVESNLMHAINGRMYGNIDGFEMQVNKRVRWHVMGFGTEVDIHTVHWHSQTLLLNGHRTDVVELLPATFRTLEQVTDNVGSWMLHCHVLDHQIGGMSLMYHVLEEGDMSISTLSEYAVSKTDMGVKAAPRPPLAEPVHSINNAQSAYRYSHWIVFCAALSFCMV